MTEDLYFSSIRSETTDEVNTVKKPMISSGFFFVHKNEISSKD